MKELYHYGIKRRSGRYPWGSGADPEQRGRSLRQYVKDMKTSGMSEVEVAAGLGIKTTALRHYMSLERQEQRASDAALAYRMQTEGHSPTAIAKRMGINESSVRSLLDPSRKVRANAVSATADMLKDAVKSQGLVDVGVGVELHIGVSRTKLQTAVQSLVDEGYKLHYVPVMQQGTGKKTTIMTLSDGDTDFSTVMKNRDTIKMPTARSEDSGNTFLGIKPPVSVSSDRIMIRYGDKGGTEKDGTLELNPHAADLSLGKAMYAQVRVAVDDSMYMKGMAFYGDPKSFPEGVDVIYNVNKPSGTPINKVFKPMKREETTGEIDKDNPFGASIKRDEDVRLTQSEYTDSSGKKQRSPLNIVSEQGDWTEWSKTLSSQMLSKQTPELAKAQLDAFLTKKTNQFDEVNALTNPMVKKKLLDTMADDLDAASADLHGAGLPRQGWHVILPVPSLADNEIYAPNYKNGEEVALIRYPHGGVFEIPTLIVNNRNAEALKFMPNAPDAIGINSTVAKQLSGADNDGDTALVIPTNGIKLRTMKPLEGLKDFDPQAAYPYYDGMSVISNKTKQLEMGKVTNLVTDMTIRGAPPEHITRAVKHSMVVIDAEKHKLNYKQSAIDNNITELKALYQGGPKAGANTIVSRAGSEVTIKERKLGQLITGDDGKKRRVYVDPTTGKKLYEDTEETYTVTTTLKDGTKKTVVKAATETAQRMLVTDDAYTLVGDRSSAMEVVYADHANQLKALANQARLTSLQINPTPYNPTARKEYDAEVTSLSLKLKEAQKNAPLERRAQIVAASVVSAKVQANPNMTNETLKKIRGQALSEARARVGAGKTLVQISDREWEAIQAGAVSSSRLTSILNNTDIEQIKIRATPRVRTSVLSDVDLRRARSLLENATQAEVAELLGISVNTLRAELYQS